MRIADCDEEKTAFRTKYGLYEYMVMLFRLTNAPSSFQRWINELLSEYLDLICLAYLDDVLIYSDNLEEHVHHVRTILGRLREAGLALKLNKCEFHMTETEYLGYVITPVGIHMDKQKLHTMNEWPQLPNVKCKPGMFH